MHRRFPFPNPQRFQNNPQHQEFLKRIQKAFALFESGDYGSAGVMFEELAKASEARRGPRFPFFYLQAGRCYLYANRTDQGWALVEKARQGFIQTNRPEAAQRLIQRLKDEIQSREPTRQPGAGDPPAGMNATTPLPRDLPDLPLKCPSCGAAIHPDEVAWLDVNTAECDYCGSTLRA